MSFIMKLAPAGQYTQVRRRKRITQVSRLHSPHIGDEALSLIFSYCDWRQWMDGLSWDCGVLGARDRRQIIWWDRHCGVLVARDRRQIIWWDRHCGVLVARDRRQIIWWDRHCGVLVARD